MPRKRRVSDEEEEEAQVDEDGEEGTMELSQEADDADPSPEPDENEDDEEGQEEEDEHAATPPSAKRRRQESQPPPGPRALNRKGEVAQVGIIQQIKVENFMCHRKLRVDLCRNINFIHGQNGSGKSAILAALQICLGAGARRTHRARNLKGLVRTDHVNQPSHAKLSVTVHNQGEDAYKHDEYGDRITVERTIACKSGSYNGYKLFDADGKEVSRSRKDLDDMLDHLNIQVENPVAILDQEEAKKFLSGKAEDKYKFFMKACELERLDQSYATTADKLEGCQNTEEQVAGDLHKEEQKVVELKKKYEQFRELDKIENNLHTQQCKMAWALWKVSEKELDEAKQKLKEFQEKATKKREELTQAEKLSQESMQGHDHVSQRVKELTEEAQQLASQIQAAKNNYREAQKPLKQLKAEMRGIEKKLDDANNELGASKKRLADVQEEIASSNKDAEVKKMEDALQNAENELAALREQEEPMRQETADCLRVYEEIEPQVQQARDVHKDLKKHLNAMENKLDELQRSDGDTLALLGRNVRKVKTEIERRRSEFTGPVVGPIGAYLKIQPDKKEYAALAELHLGNGTLDRFIVTNAHDRKVVQSIRDKFHCQNDCGIFQMSPGQGRFSIPPPPVLGVETVVTVLKIEDDLVFNCLVDNCRIDQVALVKDRQKSEEALIGTGRNGEKIIKGIIKTVICLPKGDSWNIKNGQQAVLSNEKQLKCTIGADKSATIAQLRREMEQKHTEVRNAQREMDRLDGQHSEYQRNWNQSKKALRKNGEKIENLQDKIEQMKTDIRNAADYKIDTSEFDEDLRQQEENVKKIQQEREEKTAKLEEMEPEVKELKEKVDDIQNQMNKASSDLDAAEAEMTKFLETQSQRKDVVAKKKEKINKYEQVIEMHSGKISKIQNEYNDYLFKARKIQFRLQQRKQREQDSATQDDAVPTSQDDENAPEPTHDELEAMTPVNVDKDVDYYASKIERLQKKLDEERKKRRLTDEDPTEAYEKYIAAKEAVMAQMASLEHLQNTIEQLESDLKTRRKRWKHFRKHLEHKTSEKFQELLLMNKYTGDLEFDHDQRYLNLSVQKQNANQNSSAAAHSNDVKGLSGGERSYTTISLLLSLGESLETPFRVMDEFDVFLDPQVRKLTIRALIHTAKQMQHRQFIFITPQDLTGIDPDPQLKIFKLNPPDRFNTVGPSQQTLNLSQA